MTEYTNGEDVSVSPEEAPPATRSMIERKFDDPPIPATVVADYGGVIGVKMGGSNWVLPRDAVSKEAGRCEA